MLYKRPGEGRVLGFREWHLTTLLIPFSFILAIFCLLKFASSSSAVFNLSPLGATRFTPNRVACVPNASQIIEEKCSHSVRRNNGLTTDVEWDDTSLFIRGQRVFIWSGEFHPWRLPVPEMWRDILEKMVALGLNTVSIPVHWGLVNPAPGIFDFNGYRDLKAFCELALDVGLWVILRPDTSAGGLPHWVISTTSGQLRANTTEYAEKWRPYIRAVCQIAKVYQVSLGGPIIAVQVENKYMEDDRAGHAGNADMMLDIENEMRMNGIVGFDCSRPEIWKSVVENYYDYHMNTNPYQPWFTPEFQAGAPDAWGPGSAGYDACAELTGPEFESVFYRNLLAANFKLINLYMIYGGTSWGYLSYPGVIPLLRPGKAAELKRQTLFVRSTPEFYNTVVVGNSSSSSGVVRFRGRRNMDIFGTLLRNPDTGAQFYVMRHLTSNATGALGASDWPFMLLAGRESKMVITDLTFGVASKLLYSTAQVLWAGRIGDRDALVLHGATGQFHEAAVRFPPSRHITAQHPLIHVLEDKARGANLITIQPGVKGLVVIWDSLEQIILYADTETAGTLWFPRIVAPRNLMNNPGPNTSLLVSGPYLVRDAKFADGDGTALNLRGDLIEGVRLVLVGLPPTVRRLTWNGQLIEADIAPAFSTANQARLSTSFGSTSFVEATLTYRAGHLSNAHGENNPFDPPKLLDWMYTDALPEILANFSDADWTLADHRLTNSPYKPYGGPNATNLYGCDYGLLVKVDFSADSPLRGITIYRGHFHATGLEQATRLSLAGGQGFAASVWINDVFLGTECGNVIAEQNQTFIFPNSSVVKNENVLTIVLDNMGFDESEGWNPDSAKSVRGIRDYELIGGKFSSWRLQGKLGGFMGYRDKFRGVLNEGGSYPERMGWHLPEFDTSSWLLRSLSEGLPRGGAGLGLFVTNFTLNIPTGFDVPMSFVFDHVDQPYRALLFANGWMMGKRVANLGPQYKFPVHQGIINYRGVNTVAVLLWVLEDAIVNPSLKLVYDAVIDGGINEW
ncbi:uncharacterized protein EI90DRAFT_3062042 [Cantharellus anzutake]|uniref:uncharacterized protein n=1 Tax=Cantharellus anzutake TaxID=1750568 RepID=UPI001904A6A5|nr:uncharacterized protein EI90DRAFT_3062042 [Cantharellus anzutake]KAF8329797.1 hypothetical protein EI90DRAFT_3062042 [Cantharellus anzutake]